MTPRHDRDTARRVLDPQGSADVDDRVDLSTVLRAVARRPWLAIAVVVGTVLLGLLVTVLTPRVYASTSTVLVGETTESPDVAREDILASQDLAATYSDLARRQPVLEGVLGELGLDITWTELRDRVQVNVAPGNDQLIVVTAYAGTARQAHQIASVVTERLIELAPRREDEPVATFVTSQLEALQAELDAKQRELADVLARQESAPTSAVAEDLQLRADTLTRQINDLRGNYTDLRSLVPLGNGPNSLQVLEAPSADPVPVRPNLRANLLAAGLIGVLLALGACYYAEHRPPRVSGRKARAGAGDRPGHPGAGVPVSSAGGWSTRSQQSRRDG